jgi:cyclopropane-fatty-acyl-phospholipid synthase
MSLFSKKIVFGCFKKIKGGQVIFVLPDGSHETFGQLASDIDTPIKVQINDLRAFSLAISSGDIGVAEGYFKNYWHTDELEKMLRLALQNRAYFDKLIYGTWFGSLIYKIKHFLHRNTKAQSKKNIHAHYDLGNQFYGLWLDPSMMYSSALFNGNYQQALQDAQNAKCENILRNLNASEGDKILEIGCGWGNFIKRANERNVAVDGITISTEQLNYVQQELQVKGPNTSLAQINSAAVLQDYRDCNRQYDGIVSIEMFEAVGEAFWPSFFKTIDRCLKPGKKAVIQTIVIDDALFPEYRTGTDFIQQYIFPGGMLPSVSVFETQVKAAGLKVKDRFYFGQDYAQTLRIWADSFNQQVDAIKNLGFKDEFIRLWNFYLFYCAAGFSEKTLEVVQFTIEKPLHES